MEDRDTLIQRLVQTRAQLYLLGQQQQELQRMEREIQNIVSAMDEAAKEQEGVEEPPAKPNGKSRGQAKAVGEATH